MKEKFDSDSDSDSDSESNFNAQSDSHADSCSNYDDDLENNVTAKDTYVLPTQSEYELSRENNINRNNALLSQLNIKTLAAADKNRQQVPHEASKKYKYHDTTSESVEYISVEELLTAEWKDVVSPTTMIVIQNNDMNLSLPKVPVHNSNNETKQSSSECR